MFFIAQSCCSYALHLGIKLLRGTDSGTSVTGAHLPNVPKPAGRVRAQDPVDVDVRVHRSGSRPCCVPALFGSRGRLATARFGAVTSVLLASILAAGPSVFDLSESTRPGPSEVAGGREKTKTENKRGGAGGRGMKNQKLTALAPRAPLGHTISQRPKSSRLSRGGPGLPAGNQCFSGLSSGPGRGHCSLENGLSDTWIAKLSRCARLRTWGSAPQDQETTSRTLTPSLWRRRRHPVSLDRGPRGPQEAEKCFVFVFYPGGPGPQKWREG